MPLRHSATLAHALCCPHLPMLSAASVSLCGSVLAPSPSRPHACTLTGVAEYAASPCCWYLCFLSKTRNAAAAPSHRGAASTYESLREDNGDDEGIEAVWSHDRAVTAAVGQDAIAWLTRRTAARCSLLLLGLLMFEHWLYRRGMLRAPSRTASNPNERIVAHCACSPDGVTCQRAVRAGSCAHLQAS